MYISKFNSEGYPDPTAADALTRIAQEEAAKGWKPCVFICSPFAGNIKQNALNAKRYLKFAVEHGAIPFAPHLLYPQVLQEDDPLQREIGMFFGLVWLGKCDEVWVFGDKVSEGMAREIGKAKWRGIPIRYFNNNCEEVPPCGT